MKAENDDRSMLELVRVNTLCFMSPSSRVKLPWRRAKPPIFAICYLLLSMVQNGPELPPAWEAAGTEPALQDLPCAYGATP